MYDRSPAERAYQRASFHWSLCLICNSVADPERANVNEFCATGQALAAAWAAAERIAAGIEVEAEPDWTQPPIVY